jgi:hypothetical protein
MPMRWVLPGGATLSDERRVVCRPHVAVVERTKKEPTSGGSGGGTGKTDGAKLKEWLPTIKQVLGVLTALVGLIGAVLALFGWSRK